MTFSGTIKLIIRNRHSREDISDSILNQEYQYDSQIQIWKHRNKYKTVIGHKFVPYIAPSVVLSFLLTERERKRSIQKH